MLKLNRQLKLEDDTFENYQNTRPLSVSLKTAKAYSLSMNMNWKSREYSSRGNWNTNSHAYYEIGLKD